MAYKIQSKVNIFHPQVEPGVVIDDNGNIYLNSVNAREINQVPESAYSPSIGTDNSFIVAGGGFASPLQPTTSRQGVLSPEPGSPSGAGLTAAPPANNPDPSILTYEPPTSPFSARSIDPTSPIDPGGVASTLQFVSLDLIQKFPYAISSASATQLGDVSGTSSGYAFAAGHQSQTHGYVSGGAANNVTFPHGVGGELHYELADLSPNSDQYRTSGGKGYIGMGDLNGTPSATWEASNLCDPSDPISPYIHIGRIGTTVIPRQFPVPQINPVTAGSTFGSSYYPPYTAVPFTQPELTSAPVLAYPGLGNFYETSETNQVSTPQKYRALPATQITRTVYEGGSLYRGTPSPVPTDPTDNYKYANSFMYELVGYNANIKDDINKFPFAIGPSGSGTDVGQLSFEVVKAGGHSSEDKAWVSGGAIKGFPNPAASAFVPYNTEYNQANTGTYTPYADHEALTFETKVYDQVGRDGWTSPYPAVFEGSNPISMREGHPYIDNPGGVPSANLELAFVTNKIQYYPFAISSAVAEVSSGDLGLFETWESQSGATGLPLPSPFESTGNEQGLDGRPIFYGRFNHGAASSSFEGFTVGGQIAGVVVNETFTGPHRNGPFSPTTPLVPLSSRTPNGIHHHYRIMTPANFMQRADYINPFTTPPQPFEGARNQRFTRDYGEIFTNGDFYNAEPASYSDSFDEENQGIDGGGSIAAASDQPNDPRFYYSLPDGTQMNNSGWAPYIGAGDGQQRIPFSYELKAEIVNSDILKFPFSSSATVSVVGQLASYGTGAQLSHPTMPPSPSSDFGGFAPSAQRALTNRDEITVLSGPANFYVMHSHNSPNYLAGIADSDVLIRYPYSNLTPSVVADMNHQSTGNGTSQMGRAGSQSQDFGFLSGGSFMAMRFTDSPIARELYTSTGAYRQEIDKFPFSSFGQITDVGDLAAFTSNAMGIND